MPESQDPDHAPDPDDTPADRSSASTEGTPVGDRATEGQDDDAQVDMESDESFPASDPPANY
jgi:hypothetical protein